MNRGAVAIEHPYSYRDPATDTLGDDTEVLELPCAAIQMRELLRALGERNGDLQRNS